MLNQCSECGKSDDTVYLRNCGYDLDVNGVWNEEMICNACEDDHIAEI